MFHLVSYWWIRKTQVIPRFGEILQECGKIEWNAYSIPHPSSPCIHFLSLFFFFSPFFVFFSQPFSNFLKSSTGMFLHIIKRSQTSINILVYFFHPSMVIHIPKSIPVWYFSCGTRRKCDFSSSSRVFWSICFLTSEVVVVVPDDELLDESSFLEQEMMVVAEKHEIRNIYKIFLFFSSIPKVKNYANLFY